MGKSIFCSFDVINVSSNHNCKNHESWRANELNQELHLVKSSKTSSLSGQAEMASSTVKVAKI